MKNNSRIIPVGSVVFLFTIIATLLYAQAPDTLWTKTYGGLYDDAASSVQQTSDDGYIVVGETESYGAGESDIYLIKTDTLGETLWTRTYGGTGWDVGLSVQQTSDSGYIVAGCTESYGAGESDIYLIKTDTLGETLWTRTYGGTDIDYGYSVQQTSDDGYIVVGETESYGAGGRDIYLIKTDTLGETLWTRTYGGTGWDIGMSVQQTSDTGYIVAGRIWSVGPNVSNVYLIKTDASGDSLWAKIYGGTSSHEMGGSVQQTSDSGYIVAGVTTTGPGQTYGYLIKTYANGDTLWTETYGEGGDYDWLVSVQETSDSGYIVAGYTDSQGAGGLDVWLIKTDSLGDTLWTKTYGGLYDDGASSVQQTSDGGYIVAGGTGSFGGGGSVVWLLKIAPEPGIEEDKVESVKSSNLGATIFRGPLQLPEGQDCKVFDITGRVVELSKIQPGIYFIEIDGVVTQKVVKVR